jgi:hypothetical protein
MRMRYQRRLTQRCAARRTRTNMTPPAVAAADTTTRSDALARIEIDIGAVDKL